MRYILVLIAISFTSNCFAQEESERPWSVGLMIGHHRIFEGVSVDDEEKTLLVPSWSATLARELNERWFIGLHVDLIVEPYTVQTNASGGGSAEDESLEREFPLIPALIVGRTLWTHHAIIAGAGVELEGNEQFGVLRLGYEFGYPMTDRFEFLASLDYDHRIDGYNSMSLLVGIAYFL